jgi:hypothetical protein
MNSGSREDNIDGQIDGVASAGDFLGIPQPNASGPCERQRLKRQSRFVEAADSRRCCEYDMVILRNPHLQYAHPGLLSVHNVPHVFL